MKKTMAMLLALIMLLSAVPAFASNSRTSGLFTYEIKGNGTAIITDFDWKSNKNQDVYIPNMIDGYTVTTIGEGAFSVGDNEYYNKLVVVTIPDTVTTLEEKAFFLAPVSAINIPQNLRTIGSGALTTQSGVQFNLVPKHQWFAIIENALYEKSTKKLIAISGTEPFLDIPDGIKTIGAYACYNGQRANALASMGVYVPDSVTTIEEYAFANISLTGRLKEGYGFAGVQVLGEGCFRDVLFHEPFTLPEGIKEIPAYAFESSSITDYFILPNSIEEIGDYAFSAFRGYSSYCDYFRSANNLVGVEIEEPATSSTLPSNLKRVGNYAFYRSNEVFYQGEVILPDGVEFVGIQAFADCDVTNCVLPASITEISEDAFDRESVTLQVEQDCYAEAFAQEWGYNYTYGSGVEDDLSWLNS